MARIDDIPAQAFALDLLDTHDPAQLEALGIRETDRAIVTIERFTVSDGLCDLPTQLFREIGASADPDLAVGNFDRMSGAAVSRTARPIVFTVTDESPRTIRLSIQMEPLHPSTATGIGTRRAWRSIRQMVACGIRSTDRWGATS